MRRAEKLDMNTSIEQICLTILYFIPIRITSIKKDATLCAWSCLRSWYWDHTSQRV